jgi:PAS domain S-box-containing protein
LLDITRKWNLSHNGVYSEINEQSKTNPFLNSEYSTIETKDGKKLSYKNMHVMTKELSKLLTKNSEISFDIISLNPLDTANYPDRWESKVLKELDKSSSEYFEFVENDSTPKFRYMATILAEESCFTCHERRGLKSGDILGGISYISSAKSYYAAYKNHIINESMVHLLIYIFILIGIFHFRRLVNRYSDRLKNSLQEERELYDNAPFGYHTLDANGYIIRMNRKELNWLGYSEEEIIGKKKYTDLISPDTLDEYNQKCLCNAANKQKLALDDSEFYLMRKNGTSFPILLNSVAVRDKSGEVKSYLNSVLDITERKSADLIIQESERKFKNIFENVQDVFYQTDMSGILIEISPSIERYSGYKRDDLIGKSVETFYDDPEDRAKVVAILSKQGEVNDFEIMLKRKDGTKVLVSANIHIIFNKKGLPIGIEGSLRNISERKIQEEALKASEELLRTTFESISAGILVVDKNRQETHYNSKLFEMWGVPRDKFVSHGPNLSELILDKLVDPEGYLANVERIYKSSAPSKDVIELKDGKFFELVGIPIITNEETTGRVWNFYDISEQKKAELVLIEANDSKDKFFSILAHDLRSPISGFLGVSEILSKELDELSVREVKEMSSAIYSSANSIFNLLNDLLKWAQSQSDELRMEIEEQDLTALIKEATILLKTSAESKNISIRSDFDSELIINCDKNMITTVVRNLITNAIKFTPQNGTIEVSALKESNEKGNFIKVMVKDSGVGIESNLVKKLFKVGEMRSTPGTSGEKGTGLGLILCKEFVEKHGGRISVISKINEGSTFSFTLPIASAAEEGLF